MQWTETLVVTYPETIDVDVDDDLNRELALCVLTNLYYSTCLYAPS